MKRLAALLIFCSTAFGGYSYARAITVDHTRVGAADLTDFTISINGTYAYLATAVNRGKILHTAVCGVDSGVCPADLIFTRDSLCAQPLKWEIERYDPSSGTLAAWVNVPLLSHTSDSVIYACYGNVAVNTFQGGAVCSAWDAGTRAIYHLENIPINDSGCGGLNLASSGSPLAVPGAVGYAVSFPSRWQYSGAEAHNYSAASGAGNGSITLSAWVQFAGFSAQDVYPTSFVGLSNVTYPHDEVTFAVNAQNQALFYLGDDGGYNHQGGAAPTPMTAGMWYFLAGTWDGSRMIFYFNGVQISSNTLSFSRTDRFVGMSYVDTLRYSQLALDEVKISNVARPGDWILAEYNNQSSPSTFYAVGSEITMVPTGQASVGGGQSFIE